VDGLLGVAQAGLNSSLGRLDKSARNIAGGTTTDLAGETIEQISAQRSFEATAKLIQTADENLGTIIDIKR